MADPPALVVAGGSGHDDEIDQAVADVPAQLRLLRPGYLRFADLPGYLGGALVAAYPSHGEGFGLAILEAMACGAPVLTTPRLSLPEVGGDAVAYTGESRRRRSLVTLARCSPTSPAGSRSRRRAPIGPRNSPGRPAPKCTWRRGLRVASELRRICDSGGPESPFRLPTRA